MYWSPDSLVLEVKYMRQSSNLLGLVVPTHLKVWCILASTWTAVGGQYNKRFQAPPLKEDTPNSQ